jgi:hypothetical protein
MDDGFTSALSAHDVQRLAEEFLDLAFSRSPDEADRLASLIRSHGFSWHDVLRRSIDTYLAPALQSELEGKGIWSQIPSAARDVLNLLADLNRSRNQRVLSRVSEIASTLDRIGITTVFLKGAACLASGAYVGHARRFMIDIDALVPKDRFWDAVTVLLNSGYSLLDEELYSDPLIGNHYPPLLSPDGFIAVEIHRCFRRLNAMLSPDEVFREAIELELRGASIRVPRKEHILAHHVLHAQERRRDRLWPRVHQVADLGFLIEAWDGLLEWPSIFQQLAYQGDVCELRDISRSATELLSAVRAGESVFTARAAPANIHDCVLRRFPALKYIDPLYMTDMWVAGKFHGLRKRLMTRQGRAWLRRRAMSNTFWTRARADLRAV